MGPKIRLAWLPDSGIIAPRRQLAARRLRAKIMANYSTSEFRSGLRIIIDSDPCIIVDNEFVKPGKGQALLREALPRLAPHAQVTLLGAGCCRRLVAVFVVGLADGLGFAVELLEQAQLMQGYGANCLYITDSAGYMLPDDVTSRVELARKELKPETELGFHGHHNLHMGIANSLAAIEAGASRIDGASASAATLPWSTRPNPSSTASRSACATNMAVSCRAPRAAMASAARM